MVIGAEADNRGITSSTSSANVMDFARRSWRSLVTAEGAAELGDLSIVFFFIFGHLGDSRPLKL